MRVPAVDVAPPAKVVKSTPGLRLELLDCTSQIGREECAAALASGDAAMDISRVEGVAGLAPLVREVPPARVLLRTVILSEAMDPRSCSRTLIPKATAEILLLTQDDRVASRKACS